MKKYKPVTTKIMKAVIRGVLLVMKLVPRVPVLLNSLIKEYRGHRYKIRVIDRPYM